MPSEPAVFRSAVKAREFADNVVGPYRAGLRTFVLPTKDGGYKILVETAPGLGGFATWPSGRTKKSKQTSR